MSSQEETFGQRLKSRSRTDHDSVDNLVMSVSPFANAVNYGRFLQLQAIFHRVVDDIYKNADLNRRMPGLAGLARYEMVKADMADLHTEEAVLSQNLPQPQGDEAIGWLYCAEGSNLGAALLFKEVKKIHFDEHHGASHLAGHPDGRAKHWRAFVDKLNGLALDEAAEERAIAGAQAAFAFYKHALREVFALAA